MLQISFSVAKLNINIVSACVGANSKWRRTAVSIRSAVVCFVFRLQQPDWVCVLSVDTQIPVLLFLRPSFYRYSSFTIFAKDKLNLSKSSNLDNNLRKM